MQEKVEKEQVADVIEQDLTLLALPEELADLESVADGKDLKKSGIVSSLKLISRWATS